MENQREQQPIIKKVINIIGLDAIKKSGTDEIIGAKLIAKDGEREAKYTLWFNKSNGEPTKAYTQFRNQMIGIGSEVGIAFSEEPNQFTYKDKKTGETKEATSTNRKIAWFSDKENIKEFGKIDEKFQDKVDNFGEPEHIDVSKIPW